MIAGPDFDAIIGETLRHKDVAMYLHPEVSGRVPVRIAFPPPFDGRAVNLMLYGEPAVTVTDPQKSADAFWMAPECKEQRCKVTIRYRPEGIKGYVTLVQQGGQWTVEKTWVLE